MFRRIGGRRQDDREWSEIQRWHAQLNATLVAPEAATGQQPKAAVVDDFLPPDLRMPTREEICGMMMRWETPLVIDGEIRECPRCGAYRDWIVLSVRDQIWLRCRAGHETLETRLDTAWYNRSSGPMDRWHPTLEDGLKHLGH